MSTRPLALCKVDAARALAWALLLSGWIGLGALADRFAPGPFVAFGLLAVWLVALGGFATLAAWLPSTAGVRRLLLVGAAALAAPALMSAVHGEGLAALLVALLGWALLTAMASATVRALRGTLARRAGPPIASAAIGALLAVGVAGDPTDLVALATRLAALLGAAAVALALLHPAAVQPHAKPGCRAGLFDCSLPAWPLDAWRDPARRPLLLASIGMLPMMCGLPQMLALCRVEAIAPQLVLAVHLGAMFVPALLWRGGPRTALVCAALLAAGGAAVWLAGPVAWWWLALLHGGAWSLAWSAQLADATLRPPARGTPLRHAAGQALMVLVLGVAVAVAGNAALLVLQLGIAAAAALLLIVTVVTRLARLSSVHPS